MQEKNTSNINIKGDGSSVGSVATGSGAQATTNYGSGTAASKKDVPQVEALLKELLAEIDRHAGELAQADRARNAVAVLQDEVRDEDADGTLIERTVQRLRTAVDAVGPLVTLAGKVSEAVHPWVR